MTKPLDEDLRVRVVGAVREGMSRHASADLHFPALPLYSVPVMFFLMVKTLAGPRSRSYRLQITCICR